MPCNPKGIGNDISGFYLPAVNRSKNDFVGAFGNDNRSDLLSESHKKIDIYSKNGFIQSRDIIYTFESEKCSLNTMSVENIISQYLAHKRCLKKDVRKRM